MPANKQILLDNRPQGEATASNFKLVSTETPPLREGEVLVRHHYLSLDPYMRGRMNDAKSYAAPQPLGQVMQGGTVGEVVESRSPKYAAGDKVVGMGGWQEYSVANAEQPGALRPAVLQRQVDRDRDRLAATWRLVQSLNPDAVLDRGYARVTTREGQTLASAAAVREAGAVTLRFRDDSVDAIVGDLPAASAPAAKVERKPAKPQVAVKADQPTLL